MGFVQDVIQCWQRGGRKFGLREVFQWLPVQDRVHLRTHLLMWQVRAPLTRHLIVVRSTSVTKPFVAVLRVIAPEAWYLVRFIPIEYLVCGDPVSSLPQLVAYGAWSGVGNSLVLRLYVSGTTEVASWGTGAMAESWTRRMSVQTAAGAAVCVKFRRTVSSCHLRPLPLFDGKVSLWKFNRQRSAWMVVFCKGQLLMSVLIPVLCRQLWGWVHLCDMPQVIWFVISTRHCGLSRVFIALYQSHNFL